MAGETVIVGCKIPNGVVLDIGQGRTYTLAGANSTDIINGHGMTMGVPKDFFDEWVKQHKDSPLVRNGLVFAQTKSADANAEAKEKQTNKSGLEGLDPNKPGPGIEKSDGK